MASLTVSTRSLRYSSAMTWRLRSAVCGAARLCNQRSIHRYSKHPASSTSLYCLPTILSPRDTTRSSSKTQKSRSASLGARRKSSWSRNRMSVWDKRFSSFWHRPDCQWVNSDGDPRTVPRDNGCPGCREDRLDPEELAPRELLWRRKMHFIKRAINKDPYQALFGFSNDLLKGVTPRLWLDFDRDLLKSENHPFSEPTSIQHRSKGVEPASEAKKSPDPEPKPKSGPIPKQQAIENTPREDILKPTKIAGGQGSQYRHEVKQFVINQSVKRNASKPTVHGYGTWEISGRDGDSSYKASGELEYDPITMRMVPKLSSRVENTQDSKLAVDKVKENAIQIPVKKSPDSLAPIPKEQSRENSIEISKEITPQESDLPNLKLASALLKQTDESLKAAPRETSGTLDAFKPPQGNSKASSRETESAATLKNKERIPTKTALEQSWVRETAARHMLRKEETVIEKGLPSVKDSPRRAESIEKHLPRSKDRPLKHMNARELGEHRAALLKAWNKRRAKSEETAADRMLKEEIRKQKLAMQAMENRWRLRNDTTSTTSISSPPADRTSNSMKALQGKGDIDIDAANYTFSNIWYKRKAPHALLHEKHKIEDRTLVRSIRRIYEAAYGIIDTRHTQGSPKENPFPISLSPATSNESLDAKPGLESIAGSTSDKPTRPNQSSGQLNASFAAEHLAQTEQAKVERRRNDPQLYQILAYDRSEKSIYTAVASSSYTPPTGEKIISVSDALVKLHAPAKFLPHLTKHQANGYEIVSANKNILVLKRTQQADALPEESSSSSEKFVSSSNPALQSSRISRPNVNPIDGTGNENWMADLRPHTGNFASPTGFVNHDVYAEQTANTTTLDQEAPSSAEQNLKVKRQEPVFSGQQKARSDKSSSTATSSSSSNCASSFGSYKALRKRLRDSRFQRVRRISRRIFSIGLFTALVCYVTGVIVESLRNGDAKNAANLSEKESGETRQRRWSSFSAQSEAEVEAGGAMPGSSLTSKTRQQQSGGIDEEKAYAIAKAFVAGAVLLPVLKFIFRGGR